MNVDQRHIHCAMVLVACAIFYVAIAVFAWW